MYFEYFWNVIKGEQIYLKTNENPKKIKIHIISSLWTTALLSRKLFEPESANINIQTALQLVTTYQEHPSYLQWIHICCSISDEWKMYFLTCCNFSVLFSDIKKHPLLFAASNDLPLQFVLNHRITHTGKNGLISSNMLHIYQSTDFENVTVFLHQEYFPELIKRLLKICAQIKLLFPSINRTIQKSVISIFAFSAEKVWVFWGQNFRYQFVIVVARKFISCT